MKSREKFRNAASKDWRLLAYAVEESPGEMPKHGYRYISTIFTPSERLDDYPMFWFMNIIAYALSARGESVQQMVPSTKKVYDAWERMERDYHAAENDEKRLWGCVWHPQIQHAVYFPFRPVYIYPRDFHNMWHKCGLLSGIILDSTPDECIKAENPFMEAKNETGQRD